MHHEDFSSSKHNPRNRPWHRIVRWFTAVGELGTTVHGFSAIGSIAAGMIAAVAANLSAFSPYRPLLIDVLLVVIACSGVLIILLSRRVTRLRHTCESYDEKLKSVEKDRCQLRSDRERFAECNDLLRTLQARNAQCDKTIFELLNAFLLGEADTNRILDLALGEVHADLRFSLQTAADILRVLTDEKCATSLKVIVEWGNGNERLSGARVQTVCRDPTSQAMRGSHDDRVFPLTDNTATEQILLRGEDFWVSNDLLSLSRSGHYKNSRLGWERDYRATIAVPVHAMRPSEYGVRRWGVFFADSLHGAFEHDACKGYMQQLSWRFAVMLYREERLRLIRGELPKSESGPIRRASV